MSIWDPRQYLKFSDDRLKPALDLIAEIELEEPVSICDLGCGPGTVTRILAERWPGADVIGIDSSPDMLMKAEASSSEISWHVQDIQDWHPDKPVSMIFSNAALHWLDDHDILFPGLIDDLEKGGVLAVQMPRNHQEPSHALMTDLARMGPWKDLLEPLLRPAPVAVPEVYREILEPCTASLKVWETVYSQSLVGENPVLEWVGGTSLKPFLDAFDRSGKESWKRQFLDEFGSELKRVYPKGIDGNTLFPFRRLFVLAVK